MLVASRPPLPQRATTHLGAGRRARRQGRVDASAITTFAALIGVGAGPDAWRRYQATDTTLNRQVALKILPEAFTSDPDRLARFQREAQVLASLNHPGIAAIYGVEEAEDTRALVLELVEGPRPHPA